MEESWRGEEDRLLKGKNFSRSLSSEVFSVLLVPSFFRFSECSVIVLTADRVAVENCRTHVHVLNQYTTYKQTGADSESRVVQLITVGTEAAMFVPLQ